MSDFGYIIGQLRTEVEHLKKEMEELKAFQQGQLGTTVQEQGQAIRDMTLVLERVVNVVIPMAESAVADVPESEPPTTE